MIFMSWTTTSLHIEPGMNVRTPIKKIQYREVIVITNQSYSSLTSNFVTTGSDKTCQAQPAPSPFAQSSQIKK